MPLLIQNLTDEPHQRHVVTLGDYEAVLWLRFLPPAGRWFASVEYRDRAVRGVALAVGTLHIRSTNMPLDLAVIDNSGEGLDPMLRSDWATGRCSLYMLTADEMEALRGGPVPI